MGASNERGHRDGGCGRGEAGERDTARSPAACRSLRRRSRTTRRRDRRAVQGARAIRTGCKIVNLLATSRRAGLRVRAERAARALPADGLAPSEEADRRRPARARAARQVGVLLAEARRRREARGGRRSERSVLLMTTTADELREEVRRRYAESARAVTEASAGCGCGSGSCCADGESDARERSARRSTTPSSAASSRTRPCSPRSAAATRPPSPTCARARRCSTSARAAGST